MLPAEFRLKINNKTTSTWKNKKDLFAPEFKLVYRVLENKEKPKIGFIVSGKVGNAVKRNRVRRLLTEKVRENIDSVPPGTEAIFIANKKETDSYEGLGDQIKKTISRIN